ncbi:stage II sporulation protein R [Hydrogenispora ethanolica]|uniref:Stage II sporulation protein R n=1 Tax=Hydrogenispora ethanolica TaxID=1082276 RepID=A0A4R1RKN1_HYDET|nr:stage II sporulation protein R [Hydrogenispora ethanolica]TCL66579.1 stage II sporulation protein R [Hydrogenispora ethanolica]
MIRQRVITVLVILIVFAGIGFMGSGIAWMRDTALDSYNQSNLIRLRVIANSDSPVDQTIKLKVRDRIIQVTEPLLLKVEDPAQAEKIILQNMERIRRTAAAELRRNGRPMPVQVSLGKFAFPNVNYPFGLLPAGEYKGLRVVLGEGKGKNWWCVLYPPLCLLAPDAPGFKGPVTQPTKVEYRLAILERMLHHKGLSMNHFWTGWSKFFGML